MVQMEQSDLLVEDLRKHIDTNRLLASLPEFDVALTELVVLSLEQHYLCQDLICEGTRHNKRRMAGCTAEIDKATFGKQHDVAAIVHEVAVHLGFDALDTLGIRLQPSHVNLDVKVSNV